MKTIHIEIWDIVSISDAELLQNNRVDFAKCFDNNELEVFKELMIENNLMDEEEFSKNFDSIILMSNTPIS